VKPEEREQVVELLRHAARSGGIARSYAKIHRVDVLREAGRRHKHLAWDVAVRAQQVVENEGRIASFAGQCIEAAARVEEGSWP